MRRQEANAGCFETSNTLCKRENVLDATFDAMRRSYEKATIVLSACGGCSDNSGIA
jgi:hypothetical protein